MKQQRTRTHTRRGFAMLTAIALIGLVAVAMAAAAAVFRLDLRRTTAVMEDAQLRQLLVAGERAAREKLPAAPGPVSASEAPVSLPPALTTRGATLAVHLSKGPEGDDAIATVEAALAGRVATQTLTYQRGPAGWRVASATLPTSD
jgi:hypothetical protein